MTLETSMAATGIAGAATLGTTVMAAVDPSVANIVSVVVGAIVTITMGLIAYKTVLLNKKLDDQKEKIDQTLLKAEKIEGHVNSEKTRAEGEIAALQQENRLLREVMADKKETASLLAQAATMAATIPSTPGAKVSEPSVLKKIEKNTAETAVNTAATDETVGEIQKKQDNV